MAIHVGTFKWFSTKTKDGEYHSDNAASDEGSLHDDVHEKRDSVSEVEPVDSETEERCDYCWANCTTVLK